MTDVKGDPKAYGYVVAVRAVESREAMAENLEEESRYWLFSKPKIYSDRLGKPKKRILKENSSPELLVMRAAPKEVTCKQQLRCV